MKTEVSLQVKSKFVNKFKNGYPLITKDSILNANVLDEEGITIRLVDEQNHFVAKGYYGRQNKGLGWCSAGTKRSSSIIAFLKQP